MIIYDEIGIIHRPTGATLTDTDGNEHPELAPVDGWHVNTREPVPEWAEYLIEPVGTLHRVWASGDTICYRFPDKETFRALVPEFIVAE